MEGRGVKPDSYSYDACMRACTKGNQAVRAISLFGQMVKDGVRLSDRSYSAAVIACCMANNLVRARQLLADMKARGFSTIYTVNFIRRFDDFSAFASEGRASEGRASGPRLPPADRRERPRDDRSAPCRFLGTSSGCRDGAACRFAHVAESATLPIEASVALRSAQPDRQTAQQGESLQGASSTKEKEVIFISFIDRSVDANF